jgi:hypothetical protein
MFRKKYQNLKVAFGVFFHLKVFGKEERLKLFWEKRKKNKRRYLIRRIFATKKEEDEKRQKKVLMTICYKKLFLYPEMVQAQTKKNFYKTFLRERQDISYSKSKIFL